MVDLLNRPKFYLRKIPKIDFVERLKFITHLLSLVTILLKAYSQAYILITLMPEMTSFMIRTRWSVTRADLNLGGDGVEGGKKGRKERGGEEERKERKEGSGKVYASEPYKEDRYYLRRAKSLARHICSGICITTKPVARNALHPTSTYTRYVKTIR